MKVQATRWEVFATCIAGRGSEAKTHKEFRNLSKPQATQMLRRISLAFTLLSPYSLHKRKNVTELKQEKPLALYCLSWFKCFVFLNSALPLKLPGFKNVHYYSVEVHWGIWSLELDKCLSDYNNLTLRFFNFWIRCNKMIFLKTQSISELMMGSQLLNDETQMTNYGNIWLP